jgi:ABC-type multidrug transport system fused ATPase/permease subunit
LPSRASGHASDYRDLLRLLGDVRPYALVLLVSISAALVHSSSLLGRAALTGPLIDKVAIPQAQLDPGLGKSFGGWVDGVGAWFGIDPGPEAPAAEPAAQPSAAEDARNREQIRANIERYFRLIVLSALALVLLLPLARVIRDYSADWLATRLYADLQQRLGAKLLRLPLAHHQRESTGDVIARLANDSFMSSRAQIMVFNDSVQALTQIATAIGLLVTVNWQLSIVGLVAGPPIALVMRAFGGRIRRSSRARQEQVSEVTQRLLQMLNGMKTIKAYHAEELERERFSREIMRYFKRSLRVVRNRVYSRSLVELVSEGSFVGIFFVGIWAALNGHWGLTIGDLVTFAFVSAMLYRPLKMIPEVYNTLQDALPSVRRVFDVLDAAEIPPDAADAVELTRVAEGIRFEGVRFSYGREPVLEGVDLVIRAGEVVALVGRTGSGKTTMADLLLRFHDPDEGRILIDGVDLRSLKRSSLHQLISIVTQEPFLFDGTILENIRYACPDATHDEVVEAARAANAHEFIEGLPAGYETEVGEFGSQLSGGQRQRVTIARAILRDPQVLIFDEATSSLDAKAEQKVQEAIGNLMKGRTVLLIAHRLSTVKSADRIAVLDGHRIAMIGPHDELMQRGGLYSELVQLQLS